MKAPEPMECSAKAPKCACYKALEKNAETFDDMKIKYDNRDRIFFIKSVDYDTDGEIENDELPQEFTIKIPSEYHYFDEDADEGDITDVLNEWISTETGFSTKGIVWIEEENNSWRKNAETFESVNQSITSNKIGESLAWDNRILGMAGQWRNGKYDIYSIRQDADIIGYTIVHKDYLEKKLDWMENGVLLGSKSTDIAEITFAGMKIYTGGDGSFPVMGMYENINDYYARTQNKPHPRGNMTMMEFFDQEDYEKGRYEEKKWEYEFVEWVKETYKPAPTYYDDGSPMELHLHVAEKIAQENIPKLLVGARLSLHNPSMPTLNRRDSKSSIWVLEVPDLTHLKTTKYKQNYRGKTEVFINTETTVNKFFSK